MGPFWSTVLTGYVLLVGAYLMVANYCGLKQALGLPVHPNCVQACAGFLQ